MARPLTRAQVEELSDFVNWLFEQSGARTAEELAGRANVHNTRLSAWRTGKGPPDGWNLYRLIKAALGGDARRLREVVAAEPPKWRDPLRELEAAVGVHTESFDWLLDRVEALEHAAGLEGHPRAVAPWKRPS